MLLGPFEGFSKENNGFARIWWKTYRVIKHRFWASSWGPGGFMELRETCWIHCHLSWYLSDAVVPSYDQKPGEDVVFCPRYKGCSLGIEKCPWPEGRNRYHSTSRSCFCHQFAWEALMIRREQTETRSELFKGRGTWSTYQILHNSRASKVYRPALNLWTLPLALQRNLWNTYYGYV